MARLSKTDFRLFMEAPMHLWAKKHDRLETPSPTPFDQHLMQQGLDIESLAKNYLEGIIAQNYSQPEIHWQPTYQDGNYEARADALIHDPEANTYDLYEIKSSTGIKKEHVHDAAFQALVCAASLPIRDIYLVHVNKEYLKRGELELHTYFVHSQITEQVNSLKSEIELTRAEALRVSQLGETAHIPGCHKPSTCTCPSLCHPGLPEYSIYEINRIGKKALDLKEQGILSITEIPDDYPLVEYQKRQVQVVKQGKPLINLTAIRHALDDLVFPLYFLDYETFNPGIPLYDGYAPYQHIVFQYSLHVLDDPRNQVSHYEHLHTDTSDPITEVLDHLASHLGDSGSVIVWYKTFETSRNKEMAALYPKYSRFLEDLNTRIYDLMEVFSQGYYVEAGFRGSASLKNVLPVLVPEMRYEELLISNGQDTMLAWWKLIRGEIPTEEQETIKAAMRQYCAFDTLAMVKIWERLTKLTSAKE